MSLKEDSKWVFQIDSFLTFFQWTEVDITNTKKGNMNYNNNPDHERKGERTVYNLLISIPELRQDIMSQSELEDWIEQNKQQCSCTGPCTCKEE